MSGYDFLLEKKMAENSDLELRYQGMVPVVNEILARYDRIFPEYTDHSELHALSVINYCNQLIGDQIEQMSPEEAYILLMGASLHDIGMALSDRDYEEFAREIDFGDYFETHSRDDLEEVIRDFHQEYSGLFIRKYADLMDIPDERFLFAIVQVARGHRQTDLFDETEYPLNYELKNGQTVCLPWLAALVRLADELDSTSERDPELLFSLGRMETEVGKFHYRMLRAVRALDIDQGSFCLRVDPREQDLLPELTRFSEKIQGVLELCRKVVNGRTPYSIGQEKTLIDFFEEEDEEGGREI